ENLAAHLGNVGLPLVLKGHARPGQAVIKAISGIKRHPRLPSHQPFLSARGVTWCQQRCGENTGPPRNRYQLSSPTSGKGRKSTPSSISPAISSLLASP